MKIKNWSRGSILSAIRLPDNELLFGGKLGIIKYDGISFFNDSNGLPESIYNKKVNSLLYDSKTDITLAGTESGLFYKDKNSSNWSKIPQVTKQVNTILSISNHLYIFTSNDLYRYTTIKDIVKIPLKKKHNQKNKISMIRYFMNLHTGTVFGTLGKIVIDIAALIIIALSFTGIAITIFKKRRSSINKHIYRIHLFHLKKYYFAIPLFLLPLTGAFIYPPVAVLIIGTDTDTSTYKSSSIWKDPIEKATYDYDRKNILIFSNGKIFETDLNFNKPVKQIPTIPPTHPMGATHFSYRGNGKYLISSFSGILEWNRKTDQYIDLETNELVLKPKLIPDKTKYQPIGIVELPSSIVVLDYHKGAFDFKTNDIFLKMPDRFKLHSTVSLWHYLFEIHNGRIWKGVIGPFYILHSLILSLVLLTILISGFFIYKRRKKR